MGAESWKRNTYGTGKQESQPQNGNLLRLFCLNKEIVSKVQKLSWLNQEIMTIKTMNATQELLNRKMQDALQDLSKDLAVSLEQTEELKNHGEESLRSLNDKLELEMKEIGLQFGDMLSRLKEDISEKIESAFLAASEKRRKERDLLVVEIQELTASIQTHTTEMNRKLIKLKEDHHKRLLQLRSSMDDMLSGLKQDTAVLETEIDHKKVEVADLKSALAGPMEQEIRQLADKLAFLRDKYSDKEKETELLKSRISNTRDKITSIKSSFASKADIIEQYRTSGANLRNLFPAMEQQRRVLHNRLQELKGNIRVFCRIRPQDSEEQSFIEIDDDINENGKRDLAISKDESPPQFSHRGNSRASVHNFQFDEIFDQRARNNDIFIELSQLIQSSLDGYNVCVFAYGQTGSGKTWTMSHKEDGMIPLSINKIFGDIAELETQGWLYSVEGQFVEIYNETIVDLLGANSNLKYDIKHDEIHRTTSISNVTTVQMKSKEEATQTLQRASEKRSTASTMANERSSRSHSVFILKLTGTNEKLGKVSKGTLNLVDLAGSERLNSSQAKGDRLKETQAINKSLSCLGDVIYSLAQQQNTTQATHIPYRNSKLTYLLKHSLGGDSKTLMFVNISPLAKNLGESINSLRFATKVNNTKLV